MVEKLICGSKVIVFVAIEVRREKMASSHVHNGPKSSINDQKIHCMCLDPRVQKKEMEKDERNLRKSL